jgi:uncharacterized protein YegP (UPF0339 family)
VLRFIVFQGQDQRWYWHLVASDNRPVAASPEGFDTRHAATQAANAVREQASEAVGPH